MEKGIIISADNYHKKAVAIIDADTNNQQLCEVKGIYQVGEEISIPKTKTKKLTYYDRLVFDL